MCSSCYRKYGRNQNAWNCPHVDRLLYSMGMCQTCYLSDYHKVISFDLTYYSASASQLLASNAKSQRERPHLSIIPIISKIESIKVLMHSSSMAVLRLFPPKCFKTYKVKTHKHFNLRWRATLTRQQGRKFRTKGTDKWDK